MKISNAILLLFISGNLLSSCKRLQIQEFSTALEISQNQNTSTVNDTILPDANASETYVYLAEEKMKHLGEPIIINAKPKNTFAPKIRNSFTLKKPNKLLKFNQSNSNSWNNELETVGLISFILTVIAYGIVLIPTLYPIAIVIAIIALVFGLISLIRFATSDSFYGKGFAIAAILLCAFFLLFLFVIFPATFRPFG